MALGPHDSWCYGTRTERPQVIENSSATAMLGLAGMAVLAVSESDGEVEYAIETTAATGWCPVCGAQARLHNRRPTWVRDLPAGDRAVTLVWVKRIWRQFTICQFPSCPRPKGDPLTIVVPVQRCLSPTAQRLAMKPTLPQPKACEFVGPSDA